MTEVTLHIGTHKTGTKSIQLFLDRHTEQLLDQGVLYPKSGRPQNSPVGILHVGLTDALRETSATDAPCWTYLREEIRQTHAGKVVISSEGFWRCSANEVRALSEFFSEDDVIVVVYLRNPWDYMVSLYKWFVRFQRYPRLFRRFLEEDFVEQITYHEMLSTWSNEFSRERVRVRMYDRVRGDPGLIDDFLDVLGADSEAFDGRDTRIHEGLPDTCIKALVFANRVRSIPLMRSLGDRLADRLLQSNGESMLAHALGMFPKILFHEADKDWVRKHAQDQIDRVYSDFLQQEDKTLLQVPGDSSPF